MKIQWKQLKLNDFILLILISTICVCIIVMMLFKSWKMAIDILDDGCYIEYINGKYVIKKDTLDVENTAVAGGLTPEDAWINAKLSGCKIPIEIADFVNNHTSDENHDMKERSKIDI